jgi:MraZ protein
VETPLAPVPPPPLRPPVGIFSSRCDDKGRCRLPKEFEDFLRASPDGQFFVTSIDGGSVIRVYPISVWEENKKILEGFEEDPEAGEDISYMADFWGGLTPIDSQGRVLIPPVLRRQAGIEDQKVLVRWFNSAVEIYSEPESQKRLERASQALAANLKALRRKGLK